MKNFITSLIVTGLIFCSTIVSAQMVPRFLAPDYSQTGFYGVSSADNNVVTPYARSGATFEVIPSGGTIFGTTIPSGETILWGNISFPDQVLYFQTASTTVVDYNTTYPVGVYTLTFPNSVSEPVTQIVATGNIEFDPTRVGSGSTIDFNLNFTVPTNVYRHVLFGQKSFRIQRHITNYPVDACDRSGVVDFSPPPPLSRCN